jgi:hypothetical protein
MLARAERRSRQAGKLVDKWKARLVELDRAGVAAYKMVVFDELMNLRCSSRTPSAASAPPPNETHWRN